MCATLICLSSSEALHTFGRTLTFSARAHCYFKNISVRVKVIFRCYLYNSLLFLETEPTKTLKVIFIFYFSKKYIWILWITHWVHLKNIWNDDIKNLNSYVRLFLDNFVNFLWSDVFAKASILVIEKFIIYTRKKINKRKNQISGESTTTKLKKQINYFRYKILFAFLFWSFWWKEISGDLKYFGIHEKHL